MKILFYSRLDAGGQAQQIVNYIRNNTPHKATNVVVENTYLNYPADVIITKDKKKDVQLMHGFPYAKERDWTKFNLGEAMDDYDFFIFRWIPCNFMYDLARSGKVHADNTIIKFHGSEARYYPGEWRAFWEDTKITYVTNGYDYTLSRDLGYSVQHIPPMVPCEFLWKFQMQTKLRSDGTFWIAHAPTDPAKKGTDMFLKTVDQLRKDGLDIDVELITGKPYGESLALKAQCHALFDQISQDVGIGTFGVNLIEGLATSKICLGGYNKFTYSYYPELDPGRQTIFNAHNQAELYGQIKQAYEYRDKYKSSGYELWKAGREFATSRFDTKIVGGQWKNLIEFIVEGAAK